jgi:hypothetical protein
MVLGSTGSSTSISQMASMTLLGVQFVGMCSKSVPINVLEIMYLVSFICVKLP